MKPQSARGLPCDIFCSVVDNFGDIGVAWRLCRQLAAEHGLNVRLWLDDLATLQRIWPKTKADTTSQRVEDIEICHWLPEFPDIQPAPIVIETFGCSLPENYLAAMARQEPRPLWINLDHLTAEAWIKGCHRLPSPHPRLPLTGYFYYPGFEHETGGLIREAGLQAQRDAYRADTEARNYFWQSLHLAPPADDTLTVSLFAYDNPGMHELLDAWSAGQHKVRCLAPEGVVLKGISRFLGEPAQVGQTYVRGNLEICVLPFLDQLGYDQLLWSCDLNFVRGEDSFVRAQWAALPFVWNIYVQPEEAHWPKLAAFLDLYCQGLEPDAATAYRSFVEAWNRGHGVAEAWPGLQAQLPKLSQHAMGWAETLARQDDLCTQLMLFCKEKL